MWRSFQCWLNLTVFNCRFLSEITHNHESGSTRFREIAVTSQTGIKIVVSFCVLVYLNLDIVVTLKVVVVFSDAKTNEKTQTQTGLIISFIVLYGKSHLSEIYSVSIQWLKQKPLPPPHICSGSVLIYSRLNALDELRRENKSGVCVLRGLWEWNKWVFETEVTPSLLNFALHLPPNLFPRSWAQGKQCFSLLILSVIVYTPLRVCVYVRRWRFDPAVVHVSLHGVPPLTNTHFPIIFTDSQFGWEERASRQ